MYPKRKIKILKNKVNKLPFSSKILYIFENFCNIIMILNTADKSRQHEYIKEIFYEIKIKIKKSN